MPQTSSKKKTRKRSRTFPLNRDQLRALLHKAELKYPHTYFVYSPTTGILKPQGYWPREHQNFNKDIEFAEFNGIKKPTTYAWPPYSRQELDALNGLVNQPTDSAWPLPGAAASQPSKPKIIPATPKPVLPAVLDFKPLNQPQNAGSFAIMPQRGRGGKRKTKGRPTNRSRRWRIQNPALRPRRLPFKQVVPVQLAAGYFDHSFKITELLPELLTVYEEIRITSLNVVFLTKDVSVTAGIYTTILLDQDGYGTPLKSTATWFQRVADMPGSLVHHAVRGFKLTWVATEPDSRNYVKVIDKTDIAKTIARLYIIGQDNTLSISGVLLVRGHCLCRGQYYDATKLTVAMMKDLRIQELKDEEEDDDHDGSFSNVSCQSS